jgi:4-hydroxy-3-methylbut-2-enyl diphosphate reductase
MKVIRAEVLGYCRGVRRAVDRAEAELEMARSPVYTMGPLVHNPQVLEGLWRRGVEILREEALPGDLEGAVVIIRAHGISPRLEAALISRGAILADATCPHVRSSQNRARSLTEEGYRIFLAGEQHHGEIIGIQGFAPDCLVVAGPEEAARAAETLFREEKPEKTALLGQTTISPEEYQAIGGEICRFFPDVLILDTLCGVLTDRQNALKKLCGEAAALIVAGGKDSANTRWLLAAALSRGKPAWLVETPGDLPPEIRSYDPVGLCAGASTPDEAIDAIEEALKAL